MEIRLSDNTVNLSGYINIPMRESRVLRNINGPFVEIVKEGVFADALRRNPDAYLMFNHERRLAPSNFELYEDQVGLRFNADIDDSEVVEAAKAGRLTGNSFGMRVLEDEWTTKADGMALRTLNKIDLFEVSVLTKTPAYRACSVEVRDEETIVNEYRYEEFEPAAADVAEEQDQECREDMPEEMANEQCAIEDDGKAAFDACLANATIELLKFGGK